MLLKESLEQQIYDAGLFKHRTQLAGRLEGVLVGNTIVTDSLLTPYRDNCVTCHELEHSRLDTKNLIYTPKDLRDKIEADVLRQTVFKLVPIDALAFLFMGGARSADEFSDALEIDEEFFLNAIEMYNGIYGGKCVKDGWVMTFNPFSVHKKKAPSHSRARTEKKICSLK